MKHTKIIMVAAITAALGTGIIFSCAKDNQDSHADQTSNAECKNRDDLSRFNELLNVSYQYCIAAFLNDSATFMDSCYLETPDAFCHVTGIPADLMEEMGELAESIWPEIPEAEDNDPVPEPRSDTDRCSRCETTSYSTIGFNMITIYHIAERIAAMDSDFDVDHPLKATPRDGCHHNCRESFGYGNSAWYGCMLLCYSDLNIASLLAYEELLQEYLYDLNH